MGHGAWAKQGIGPNRALGQTGHWGLARPGHTSPRLRAAIFKPDLVLEVLFGAINRTSDDF